MALNRINGSEELFTDVLGLDSIFGVTRPRVITEHKITHVLSVIKYSLDSLQNEAYRSLQHMSIDIDDMDDQDILVHLPKMVRFIQRGLYGHDYTEEKQQQQQEQQQQQQEEEEAAKGAVLVHCAMGKSRSVTAIVAYLLWKHPHRFGLGKGAVDAKEAVAKAVQWVRGTRPIAEPNKGFMEQLELWVEMGCPAGSDDAVEKEVKYQRWLYKKEVETAAAVGRAPDWIRFEDEEAEKEQQKQDEEGGGGAFELRCKKCRRRLATEPFVVPHQGRGNKAKEDCPHYFVEALSWMRDTLELGELEGRLNCPHPKCGSSVGRYSWRGFKCSCGDWVAPAFSLQQSKVDKVAVMGAGKNGTAGANEMASRMAALGIRMPPGQRAENL
ncbi:tyrosine protein phosphatase yvh1 [Podospora pseudocomata]|uniref:protein-tyrosine-phosphatase n=1 Tax=Podospora pseudocomata TaxID=2093779 RepID=A0ABR0GA66_9PEZI|nr:tyrosine protein phosphatase yvh1 [Podospora pseudocomata]